MHKLFYSKSLGYIALDAFNALFVCLTAAVLNKEKEILIRTTAVRIATSMHKCGLMILSHIDTN